MTCTCIKYDMYMHNICTYNDMKVSGKSLNWSFSDWTWKVFSKGPTFVILHQNIKMSFFLKNKKNYSTKLTTSNEIIDNDSLFYT